MSDSSRWSEQATPLLAGATAGLCVEVGVYPLDTMKTRLQSAAGTIKAPCGRLCLFAGLPAVLYASAPSGALFFFAYEVSKRSFLEHGAPMWTSSMLAASCAEITSLILRVPFENVKQRAQSAPHLSVRYIASDIVHSEGWWGVYRGFLSTAIRELPCSLVQFPVWELLKSALERYNRCGGVLSKSVELIPHDREICTKNSTPSLSKFQFGLCGFVAGAISGAITTPLDVAKTRIMLAERDHILASGRISTALKLIYQESGFRGLFAGFAPRMGLMSIGGALFLGLYDISKGFWTDVLR